MRRITITCVDELPDATAPPAASLDPNGSRVGRGEGAPAEQIEGQHGSTGACDDVNDASMTPSSAHSVTAKRQEICGEAGCDDANDAISPSVTEWKEEKKVEREGGRR